MPTGYSKNFQSLVYDPDLIKLIKASDRKMPDTTGKSATFGAGSISGLVTLSTNSSEFLLDGAVYKYDANGTNGQFDFFGFNIALLPAHKGAARSVTALMHTENIATQNIVFAVKYVGGTRDGQIVKVYVENMESPNTVKTVFDIPSDVTSIVLLFQNLSTATNARIFLDNILIEMNPYKYIQLDSWTEYDLTVSASNWTTFKARGTPYKTKDGTWRLRANIHGSYSPAVSTSLVTISGITTANYKQAITVAVPNYLGYQNPASGYFENSDTKFFWGTKSGDAAVSGTVVFSFDIALASRPTFATDTNDYVIVSWQPGMDDYTDAGPITITATTTNPTKGTMAIDKVYWLREGAKGSFIYKYEQTSVGTAGSGDYLYSLPNGLSFNTAVTQFYTTVEGGGDFQYKDAIIAGLWDNNEGSYKGVVYVVPYDATRFRLAMTGHTEGGIGSHGYQSSAFAALDARGIMQFRFSAPIAGWKTTPTLLALPTSKDNNKTYDQTLVSITGNNGWSTTGATLFPYRTISKTTGLPVWRLAFNISGTTSATSRSTQQVYIAGITYSRAVSVIVNTNGVNFVSIYANTGAGGNTIYHEFSTSSPSSFNLSGDVELSSKPTWADEWIEPGVFVGNVQQDWEYELQVTGTGWTTIAATGTVRKSGNGVYRLEFNIAGSVPNVARGGYTATITGVVSKNIANFYQPVSTANNATDANVVGLVYPNTGNVVFAHSSVSTAQYRASGSIVLDSKPTWAVNTP